MEHDRTSDLAEVSLDGFVRVRIYRPGLARKTSVSFDENLYRLGHCLFGSDRAFKEWVRSRYRDYERDRKTLIARRQEANQQIVLPGQTREKVIIMSFSRALQRELLDRLVSRVGGWATLDRICSEARDADTDA